MFGFWLLMST